MGGSLCWAQPGARVPACTVAPGWWRRVSLRDATQRHGGRVTRGLWMLPDLWTRQRTRVHRSLEIAARFPQHPQPTLPQGLSFPDNDNGPLWSLPRPRRRRPGGLNLWTACEVQSGGRRPQVSGAGTFSAVPRRQPAADPPINASTDRRPCGRHRRPTAAREQRSACCNRDPRAATARL